MTNRDANDKKNAIQPRPKNPRRGRPSTYRPEVAALYCELVGSGASDTAAAKEAGVPRSTVKAWLGERADFAEAVEAAQVERLHALEDLSLDAIAEMDRMSKSPDYSPGQVQAAKYKYDMCVKLLTAYRQAEAARQEAEAARLDAEQGRQSLDGLFQRPKTSPEEWLRMAAQTLKSTIMIFAGERAWPYDSVLLECKTFDEQAKIIGAAFKEWMTWHKSEHSNEELGAALCRICETGEQYYTQEDFYQGTTAAEEARQIAFKEGQPDYWHPHLPHRGKVQPGDTGAQD